MIKSINLNKSILLQIKRIILGYKKPEKIVVFGSRANGTSKKISDIDIAIFGKNWSSTDINLIRDELDETIETPLKFDVVNFYSLNKKALKTNILTEGKTIYECKKNKRSF